MMSKDGNGKGKQSSDKDVGKHSRDPSQLQPVKETIPLDPGLIHLVKKGDDKPEDATTQQADIVRQQPSEQKSQISTLENAHALVIGIANYEHISRLPQTVLNDARDIYNLLIDPRYCGYPQESVQLLPDAQATQAAIRQALADLARCSDRDSTVFLYISSHGGHIESGSYAGEYLFPVDVVADTDKTITETAISGAEFSKALLAIPARKILVIFDCCYASGIGQLKGTAVLALKAGLSERYYEALQSGRGRVIIASSRDIEYSHIFSDAQNSLFTWHLLAGLRGGVLSDDGLIHIFNLFEYLQPLVTRDEPQQHPVFKSDVEENFPITLYVGGQKGTIPRDKEGFRYDAYISYVDQEPDATWVWKTLVPRLKEANLRFAVSGDVEEPGVERVVGIERGIKQSRRTLVVLSPSYLADHLAKFENVLGQALGIQEGTYRLLPVKIAHIYPEQLPVRLSMLTMLDLTHAYRAEYEFDRLVKALQRPLPQY